MTTNQHTLGVTKKASQTADLTSGETFKTVRTTSADIGMTPEYIESAEMDSNGQTAGLTVDTISGKGSFSTELIYPVTGSAERDLWESGFRTTYAGNSTTGTDISFTASSRTVAKAGYDFATNFPVGTVVKISGAAQSGNNDYFRVATATTGSCTMVAGFEGGSTMTDEPATASVTISGGQYLRNGVTDVALAFEQRDANLTQYKRIVGAYVNSIGLQFAVGQYCKVDWGIMARAAYQEGSSAGTYSVASTVEPMSFKTPLKAWYDNDATQLASHRCTNITFTYGLNVGTEPQGGSTDVGILQGDFTLEGSIEIYAKDVSFWDKAKGGTNSSACIKMEDAAGNTMFFDALRLKYTDNQSPFSGRSASRKETIPFKAYKHETYLVLGQLTLHDA